MCSQEDPHEIIKWLHKLTLFNIHVIRMEAGKKEEDRREMVLHCLSICHRAEDG
jgi:hypothetical protein